MRLRALFQYLPCRNQPGGEEAEAAVFMLPASAGLFRIWMAWEWLTFVREKRGPVARPGGNTFRNTPKIRQMLGHLIIQTVSTFSMVVACSVAGTQLDGLDPSSSLRLGIVPVSCTQV
jgi:hypothetical protein